jgi:hypothetical protein
VWFNSPELCFFTGDEVYRRAFGQWMTYPDLPYKFINRIRGNNLSDIFICGDFGLLMHYNGLNWEEYTDQELTRSLYYSLDFRNNFVVTVGTINGTQASVVVGSR